jgi:site-specific DNA-methyltransferase (adenine-specific)
MPDPFPRNLLCYGDNLAFLTDPDLFPNASVDLIYLDPPFNSQQSYNVLFKESTGAPEAAQIKAFEDNQGAGHPELTGPFSPTWRI